MFARRVWTFSLIAVIIGLAFVAEGCASLRTLENIPVAIGTAPEQPGPVSLTQKQALEDFRYLFGKIKDYYPYLELLKRTQGYDWASHESEFEAQVSTVRTSEDFAKAIARVVLSLNNGPTQIVSGNSLKTDSSMQYWSGVAASTTQEKADYWYALANKVAPSTNWTPFIASYVGGQYVVTDVAPDPTLTAKIHPGYIVTKINGIPVDEYVVSHRGNWWLPYDAERKKLCEFPRLRFPTPFTWISAEFADLSGKAVSVDMAWSTVSWGTVFPNIPPKYVTEPKTTKLLGDLLDCTIDWNGEKVGYLYLPSMKVDYAADTERLREFFTSVKDLPALIIDVRNNVGGSDLYWRTNIIGLLGTYSKLTGKIGYAMREKLAEAQHMGQQTDKASFTNLVKTSRDRVPPEIWTNDFREPETFYAYKTGGSVGYRGKVYVLTSRSVFSSSETFAASCKVNGFATLVGTSTGGDGIGVTPGIIVLPNSGMVVRFPSVMGLNPDWTANEEFHTKPDVLIEESQEDLLLWLDRVRTEGYPVGPDPELDTVLRECLDLATGR